MKDIKVVELTVADKVVVMVVRNRVALVVMIVVAVDVDVFRVGDVVVVFLFN